MDILTFVAELTKALAWPIVVVVLILAFRAPLVRLFDGLRLRRLKHKDWEAEFEELREIVPKEVVEAGEKSKRSLLNAMQPVEDDLLTYAPAGAVLAAWTRVEDALRAAGALLGLADPLSYGVAQVLTALSKAAVLKDSTRRSIDGLRHLRNLVVHGGAEARESLTPDRAREFTAMANAVVFAIEEDRQDYVARRESYR